MFLLSDLTYKSYAFFNYIHHSLVRIKNIKTFKLKSSFDDKHYH